MLSNSYHNLDPLNPRNPYSIIPREFLIMIIQKKIDVLIFGSWKFREEWEFCLGLLKKVLLVFGPIVLGYLKGKGKN